MKRKTKSQVNQQNKFGHNIVASENATVDIKNITIKGITSKDLTDFSVRVLLLITRRDFSQVNIYLQALNTINGLDNDCRKFIEILRFRLASVQAQSFEIEKSYFTHLLSLNDLTPILRDIVESSFLLFISQKSNNAAISRFNTLNKKGCYTNEIFCESIAEKIDIEKIGTLELLNLTENEACAYVRYCQRTQNFEKAVELSKALHFEYNNQNSQALLLISQSFRMYYKYLDTQRWTLSKNDYDELLELIEELKTFHLNTNDFRAYRAAAIIMANPEYYHHDLALICEQNYEECKRVVPDIENIIKKMKPLDEEELIGDITPLPKVLDQQIFIKILRAQRMGLLTIDEIREWYEVGISYTVKNDDEQLFMSLFLTALCCRDRPLAASTEITPIFENFISFPNVKKYSVYFINELGKLFNTQGLSQLSSRLLSLFIPDSPTITPLLETYCESLFDAEQFKTFEFIIDNIRNPEESRIIVELASRHYSNSSNWRKATKLLDKAIEKYPNDLTNYYLLATVKKLSSSDLEPVKTIWDKIPNGLFKEYSAIGIQLLVILAEVDLPRAEAIVVEWFIDNPNKMAVFVTDFHFSTLEYRKEELYLNNSPRCKLAVTYSDGTRKYVKLLVDDITSSEYILDSNSPLAKELKNTQVGGSFNQGVKNYTVEEKLHPVVGAFRAAIEIRDAINPGTDCFHVLTYKENDIDGLIKQIETVAGGRRTMLAKTEDEQIIPLLMRLNETHSQDLVKGSFMYLMEKESNATLFLFRDGFKESKSVILDVLSLAYLSMTGLSEGLVNSERQLYITSESKHIIDMWLKQVTSEDYKSMSVDEGKLIIADFKDIKGDENINNLRRLYNACSIIEIGNIDFPEKVVRLKKLLDVSHYSTLKASIFHSIPILCIDGMFSALYKHEGFEVYSTFDFIDELVSVTPIGKNRGIACHVDLGLPYIITYENVMNLAGLRGNGQYYGAEIINKYPAAFSSNETAIHTLSECVVRSIISNLLDHNIFGSSFDWHYTDKLVNACCMCCINLPLDMVAEEKIGLLIYNVFIKLKGFNYCIEFALNIISEFCVGHFLSFDKIYSSINIYFSKDFSQ